MNWTAPTHKKKTAGLDLKILLLVAKPTGHLVPQQFPALVSDMDCPTHWTYWRTHHREKNEKIWLSWSLQSIGRISLPRRPYLGHSYAISPHKCTSLGSLQLLHQRVWGVGLSQNADTADTCGREGVGEWKHRTNIALKYLKLAINLRISSWIMPLYPWVQLQLPKIYSLW